MGSCPPSLYPRNTDWGTCDIGGSRGRGSYSVAQVTVFALREIANSCIGLIVRLAFLSPADLSLPVPTEMRFPLDTHP